MKEAAWLLNFKSNIYSQRGEDGIIQKILEILPQNDKWCVEFGAWDGKYACNTRSLIEKKGYSAVLIEGDKEKFADLQQNYSQHGKVIPVNQFVGFNEENGLDQILKETPIPEDFDFLSIDIDGNDYHVWNAITKYQPKVVCIEFNPTIPTEVNFVQPPDISLNQGSSLLSLVELGKAKGYELVAVTHCNAFFVKTEYYSLFEIEDNCPVALRTDLSRVTYIFSGYDGTIFLQGYQRLVWHGIDLNASKIQHLPRFLRKFPPNYTKTEKYAFQIFEDPIAFIKGKLPSFKKLSSKFKKIKKKIKKYIEQ